MSQKILCTNEDFVHVCTDLQMVMTLWSKTCPNNLCTNKDYVYMYMELQEVVMLRIKKRPKGFMYKWGLYSSAHRFWEVDDMMS